MLSKRRDFIGLASGAAVALGLPSAALAAPTCTNPAPLGVNPTPWTTPYGMTVHPRVSAYTYTAAQYTQLNAAYAAMRALPNSDPRSLEAQQNVHAWFCAQCPGNPNDIHWHWTFFAWHRAFLMFHERILGSLVHDLTLRLPYWDWENPARRLLPAKYYTGALNDTTRDLQPGQSVERNAPGFGTYDLNLVPAEIALSFTNIAGDATSAGDVETHPHGFVHMSVGGLNGDMGNLELAAGDPIFYAHHANVDRLWYSWENVNGNVDPGGAFSALSFNFYDENKKYRSITAAQLIPTNHVGYLYDTKVAPPLKFGKLIPFPLQLERNFIKPVAPDRIKEIGATEQTVVSLSRLQFTGTGAFVVDVRNGQTVNEVGRFFVVPHGKDHPMEMTPRRANLQFVVSPAVAKALAAPGASLTVRKSTTTLRATRLLSTGFSAPAPAMLEGLTLSAVR